MPADLSKAINHLITRLSEAESLTPEEATLLLKDTRELKARMLTELKEKVPERNDLQDASADRLYEIKTSLNEGVQRLRTRHRGLEDRKRKEIKAEWASFAFEVEISLGAVAFDIDMLAGANKGALNKEDENPAKRLERLTAYQKKAVGDAKKIDAQLDEIENAFKDQIRENDPAKAEMFQQIQEAEKEIMGMTDETYEAQLGKIEELESLIQRFERSYLV